MHGAGASSGIDHEAGVPPDPRREALEAQMLGVPVHSPAFLFERTSRTADGDTVEFVRSLYRGDRYRLVADLSQRRDRPLAAPLAVAVETP